MTTTPNDATSPDRQRTEHPYRSFLTFDASPGSLDRVLEQLAAWLRDKKEWDANLSTVGFHRNGDRDLVVVHHEKGDAHNFRARFVEPSSIGAWTTELTVHIPDRGEGWLLLDVSNEQGRWVTVPRLAKYLIEAIDVRDGGDLRLTARPTVITTGRVQELADAICDADRNGLVFVAGTDRQLPFDSFVNQVENWSWQVLGQAETVVLDPDATTAFTHAMGTHGVRPWTLRTFRPDVDQTRDGDELRHRFITTERLARARDIDTRMLLGRIARQHAASRTLPAAVVSIANTLTRVENRYVTDAITRPRETPMAGTPTGPQDRIDVQLPVKPAGTEPAPATTGAAPSGTADDLAVEAASYLAQITLTKRLLGLDVLDEDSLRALAQRAAAPVDVAARDRVTRKVESQEEFIERLKADKQAALDALAQAEFDHASADQERAKLEDEARWLRRRLKERQDYEGAYGPTPAEEITQYPRDVIELLDRMDELAPRGVLFTGDPKKCSDLYTVDSWGHVAQTAWDALLVLADYLRARHSGGWTGGVNEYLEQTPAGYHKMPATKHAPTETGITMRRFGDERVFPVPTTVSPDGLAVMAAHFKLGRLGRIDPRLHYLDDSAGTGKVYVGYIGEHLTNTHTN
ncbi:MAG TPA: hypothetical protein VIS06_11055 [Mycobacteriales bacterium]|jgi:hypothetical protein